MNKEDLTQEQLDSILSIHPRVLQLVRELCDLYLEDEVIAKHRIERPLTEEELKECPQFVKDDPDSFKQVSWEFSQELFDRVQTLVIDEIYQSRDGSSYEFTSHKD